MPQLYLFFASAGRRSPTSGRYESPLDGLQSKQVKSMFNWTGNFYKILARFLAVEDGQDGAACLQLLNDLDLNDKQGETREIEITLPDKRKNIFQLRAMHGDLTVDRQYQDPDNQENRQRQRSRADTILNLFRRAAGVSPRIRTFFTDHLCKAMPSAARDGRPMKMVSLNSVGYDFPIGKHNKIIGHVELKFSIQALEAPLVTQAFPWGTRLERSNDRAWPPGTVMEEYVVNVHVDHQELDSDVGHVDPASIWQKLAAQLQEEIRPDRHGSLICDLFCAQICAVPLDRPQPNGHNQRLALQPPGGMRSHPSLAYYYQCDKEDTGHVVNPDHLADRADWPISPRPELVENPYNHCVQRQHPKFKRCAFNLSCKRRDVCKFWHTGDPVFGYFPGLR